jgi:hypothetical protein
MGKKLKKNIPLIAFLLFVNVVGFLSAQAYFSQASGSANVGTQIFLGINFIQSQNGSSFKMARNGY